LFSVEIESSEIFHTFEIKFKCMKLNEAKKQFIEAWKALATNWGINPTMAQMHGLLLTSHAPLSQEDIAGALQISRGNANMNIRELVDWGLVDRVAIPGERREYFSAEKDTWKLFALIVDKRIDREITPMNKKLVQLEQVECDKNDKDGMNFIQMVGNIRRFANHADKMRNKIVKADENWFGRSLMKLFK
jgi:DNA-binding transcriptional regulator GbsR (MarR family)